MAPTGQSYFANVFDGQVRNISQYGDLKLGSISSWEQ